MIKKAFLIIVPVVATIALIFVFGVNLYKNSYSQFQKDGYVIDSTLQKKIYFSENDDYKIVEKSGYVELNSTDSEQNKVSEISFVHYVDGSISTFKKAVFFDLDSLSKDSYQYYNIFPTSIISNIANEYKINYLDNSLNLKNMLMKISSNKYLVAADKIELVLKNDDVRTFDNNYLEINYLDGNIIRIDNQDISLQSVASELIVKIGNDIKIDLVTKKIYYKDKVQLNLGEITIDSDDNIEIVQTEENTKIIDNNSGSNNNGNNAQSNIPRVTDGKITVNPNNDVEEIVDETANVNDAVFNVLDFEVDANSLKTNIQIEDKDGVLSGEKTIKIVETGTNEVVYYETDTSGKTSLLLDVETLKPDTNYTLIVNQDYTKNDVNFNRDFVQKTFVTSSLGIEIIKDYARENAIALVANKKSFSNVSEFSYTLSTLSGDEIKTGIVNFENDNMASLLFQGLDSNTKYKFKINNFQYGNILVSGGYEEEYIFSTLKQKPVVGKTSFSVDKQNSKFVLYLNNVKDPDNGVTSFKSEIYELDNLIITKSALPSSKIEIDVDDSIITRHTDYRAYMYLVFNDNEKTYEIPIGSDTMNMNSRNKGPIVTFEESEITWESIKGNIYIEDIDDAIDNTQDVIVTYQNLTVSTDARILRRHNLANVADEKYILPLEVNDLKSNDTYLFTVKASVNYNDGNGLILVDIGQFLVQTGKPKNMAAEFVEQDSKTQAFSVNLKLKSYNSAEDTSLEASTLDTVTLKLYKSGFDNSQECTASNGCWSKTLNDENKSAYSSTLKDMLYFPNTSKYYNVTPETLGINTDDLEYAIYNLEISNAKDYTSYKNDLPILNNVYSLTPSNVQQEVINNSAPLKITPIKNNGRDSNLLDNTIIGYSLSPNLILMQGMVLQNITFSVYDNLTDNKLFDVTKTPTSNTDGGIDIYFDKEKGFGRGGTYYFKYSLNILSEDEVTGHESDTSGTVSPPREVPKMDIYLSSRDNTYSYWKYKIKDVDDALVGNALYYYFGTNEHVKVNVEKNTDNYIELKIPTANGKVNIYRQLLLVDDGQIVTVDDVSFYFAAIINNVSDVKYSISTNVNQAIVELDVSDTKKNNIIAADVVLTAGGKSVTLERVPVVSKKIYIEYGKIKDLKGQGSITSKMRFYYDNNYYGLDNPGLSIFQDATEQYVNIEENSILTYNSFNPTTKNISITVGGKNITIPYIASDGYISYNSKAGMFKKIEISSYDDITCSRQCTFSFDAVIPSFQLSSSNISSKLFEVSISPEITGYDDDTADELKVNIKINDTNEGICTDNVVLSKTVSLQTLKSAYRITGLNNNKTYCMTFTWSDSKVSNQNFYYPDVNEYEKIFTFSTLPSVEINKLDLKYLITSEAVRGRYLSISYRAGLTEGYTGIKYKIINTKTNQEVFSIPDTMIEEISYKNGNITKIIDINEMLDTETRYRVEIIPYIIENDVVYGFETVSDDFILKIDKPKVVFTRSENASPTHLTFKVNIRDTSNALNRHRVYDLYIKDATNSDATPELISSNVSITQINKSYIVECPSLSCTVIVKYQEDTTNTGVYVTKEASYTFNLLETFLLGEVTLVQTSDNSYIRLGFVGSYNLKEINRLIYTIVDEEGVPIIVGNIDDLNFVTDGDNYTYLDIHEDLDPGNYQIVLQFSSGDDGNVSSVELNYIKT